MQKVLVVDYGAQYAQLIARRIRECHVYSEIVPHDMPVSAIAAESPAGLVLSGGPKSVYEPGAPRVDPDLFGLGVPVLGICYGQQVMAQALGGEVARTGVGEFGKSDLRVDAPGCVLLAELPEEQSVWMSHNDAVVRPPEGFVGTASTAAAPVAAFEDPSRRLFGVQFHPEV
ncbi:MAG: glutamine-hydrolyzing GMP synthase, partial [Actinomycetota bacterium]